MLQGKIQPKLAVVQGKRLNKDTAYTLVDASKTLSWSSLYSILTSMAHVNPSVGSRGVYEMVCAFWALEKLLGKMLFAGGSHDSRGAQDQAQNCDFVSPCSLLLPCGCL